jgi:VCBS repeat-containing protein
MNSKYYVLLASLILSPFVQAYTYEEAVLLAKEKADAEAAAITTQQGRITAEQTIVDEFYAFNDIVTATKNSTTNPTGNALSNDNGYAPGAANLISSPTSTYGSLSFTSDGEFTYTINHNSTTIQALGSGDSVTDSFSYQIFAINPYAINYSSLLIKTANIVVHIIGQNNTSTTAAVYALDDENSILKGTTSITGNVTSNDKGFLTARLTSTPNSQYGALVFNSTGAYTYTPYAESTSVINLGIGQRITETYTYQITGANDITASATLTINLLGNESSKDFYALDDKVSINVSQLLPLTGKVGDNDKGGLSYALVSSPIGTYGQLEFQSTGDYSYQLDTDSNAIQSLAPNSVLTEIFTYSMIGSGAGDTTSATLTITILGDTGTSPINVEIENNDRSSRATAVNSGQQIKGHLHSFSDKDWYVLQSPGNEIIHLELCPSGSSCYDETTKTSKKGWVMYVFDRTVLNSMSTAETIPGVLFGGVNFVTELGNGTGEFRTVGLSNRRDDDGTWRYYRAHSNHLYLNYRSGAFTSVNDPAQNPLIGVVDPCFDVTNTLDIGVPAGVKEYVIAVSSPLKGDDGTSVCGGGEIILEEAGPGFEEIVTPAVVGPPAVAAVTKAITTTDEYIVVLPNTDDQYTISISSTGINPLASPAVRSASYFAAASKNRSAVTNKVIIPEIRILDKLYEVVLNQIETIDGKFHFEVASTTASPADLITTTTQSSYNPMTERVKIPKLTVESSGLIYSVELQYYPAANGQDAYLELIGLTPIK